MNASQQTRIRIQLDCGHAPYSDNPTLKFDATGTPSCICPKCHTVEGLTEQAIDRLNAFRSTGLVRTAGDSKQIRLNKQLTPFAVWASV